MRKGTIYTDTVVHLAPERFAADVPYQVVIVQLENGERITARMEGDRVAIGDRVQGVRYMLDPYDRVRGFEGANKLHERLHLLIRQPAGDFVEQQQFGFRSHRFCKFQAFAVEEAKMSRWLIRVNPQPGLIQDAKRMSGRVFRRKSGAVHRCREYVLVHGQLGKWPRDLERPYDSEAGTKMRRYPAHVLIVKPDLPAVGRDDSGEHVE